MPVTRRRLAFAFALVLPVTWAGAVQPGNPQPPGTPSATAAAKVVRQLADPDFAIRSAAALQLNNLPGDALAVVEAAAAKPGLPPESQIRLEAALRILRPRAVREPRELAIQRFQARLLHDAYRVSGMNDAAYDKGVDEAIDVFPTLRIDVSGVRDRPREQAIEKLQSAIDKGCKDPVVRCLLYACQDRPANKAAFAKAVAEVLAGRYNPAAKLRLITASASTRSFDKPGPVDEAVKLLPELAAARDLPEGAMLNAVDLFRLVCQYRGYALEKLRPYIDEYARVRPGTSEAMLCKGYWLFEAGRQLYPIAARRDEAYQLFDWAEQAFARAWELDPKDPRAAETMISVRHFQGPDHGGTRDAMELWFKRAMDADPDCYDACDGKMRYLQPAAYGSAEEMLEFGRECLKTQNWRAGIPHILCEAHLIAANWTRTPYKEYFANPATWADVAAVYEGNLLNFPDDVFHRNGYLMMAFHANKPDVGYRQSQILGDKAILKVSSPTHPTTWTANDPVAPPPPRNRK